MGRKQKNKGKGLGAAKTAMKTDKKIAAKQKKLLEKMGEADISEVIKTLEREEALRSAITEEVCDAPTPRSNFTLTAHPERDELILFGGELFDGRTLHVYNDLFFYSINKAQWRRVYSPSGPTPRSGHQMAAVATDGGQLWLFGGEHASPSQMQYYHYKDLWCMVLKTRKWEKINAPNGPSARSGHRMVASKKRLVIFGGFHDNNHSYQYFNDVHVFSLETYAWLKINMTSRVLPPVRSACCISANSDGKIIIWGGYSRAPMSKDVDRGQVHTDMFALTVDKNDPLKYKWVSIKQNGLQPPARSSVGFTTAPNGKVYCFGGVTDIEENEDDVRGQFGDELFALDLSSLNWRFLEIGEKSKVSKKSDMDSASTSAEAKKAAADRVVKTDGVFTVSFHGGASAKSSAPRKESVSELSARSNLTPQPRMSPGMCVIKGVLYIYGGIYEENDKQYTFNDFYAIDLHKLDDWKVLIPNNKCAHEWTMSDSDSDSDSESNSDDSSDSNSDDDDSEDESDMEVDS